MQLTDARPGTARQGQAAAGAYDRSGKRTVEPRRRLGLGGLGTSLFSLKPHVPRPPHFFACRLFAQSSQSRGELSLAGRNARRSSWRGPVQARGYGRLSHPTPRPPSLRDARTDGLALALHQCMATSLHSRFPGTWNGDKEMEDPFRRNDNNNEKEWQAKTARTSQDAHFRLFDL